MTPEKQGMGEVLLDENLVVPIVFLNRVADLMCQPLSRFALCLGLELANSRVCHYPEAVARHARQVVAIAQALGIKF
jgi:predicted ABC-type transport system involved in lysophospholipase L1 biosynthesis ATPase subunit